MRKKIVKEQAVLMFCESKGQFEGAAGQNCKNQLAVQV
jgi:hypothetical protein